MITRWDMLLHATTSYVDSIDIDSVPTAKLPTRNKN